MVCIFTFPIVKIGSRVFRISKSHISIVEFKFPTASKFPGIGKVSLINKIIKIYIYLLHSKESRKWSLVPLLFDSLADPGSKPIHCMQSGGLDNGIS